MLAERKLVIEVEKCVGRLLSIAIGQRGGCEAQPDGRGVNDLPFEDGFVNLDRIIVIPHRLRSLSLAESGGLAHESFGVSERSKPSACGLEPAEAELGYARVIRGMSTQRRLR